MTERLTTYQAIPVFVAPSKLGSPIGDVETDMVLLSAADFAEIEGLLDEACNQLALLSSGMVEHGGMGYSLAETPDVLAEAETLWLKIRERIAEAR